MDALEQRSRLTRSKTSGEVNRATELKGVKTSLPMVDLRKDGAEASGSQAGKPTQPAIKQARDRAATGKTLKQTTLAKPLAGDEAQRKDHDHHMKHKSSNSNSIDFNGSTDYEVDDSRRYVCGICEHEHPMSTAFRVIGCNHSFCSDCVARYVDSYLQDNISNIICPESMCKVKLEPQHCSSILPRHVYDKWTNALSTNVQAFLCDICEDEYPMSTGLHVSGCNHSFCSGCVAWYVAFSVHDNMSNIECPKIGCQVKLDPQHYTSLLPRHVFDRLTICSDFVFQCDICVNEKPLSSFFRVIGCSHLYCSDCVAKYVAFKLQENVTNIKCPNTGCKQILDPQHCRSILPPKVFDKWGDALCEASILCSEKLYCPYKDCSSLLIKDCDNVTIQSECPDCHRLFCAQCKVPWHSEISCELFQKLNNDERKREDMMLLKLAEDNKWKRCPNCGFIVEKSSGCLIMNCRCKCTFCYECGAAMKDHSRRTCNPMYQQGLNRARERLLQFQQGLNRARERLLQFQQGLNGANLQNGAAHPRFPQGPNGAGHPQFQQRLNLQYHYLKPSKRRS